MRGPLQCASSGSIGIRGGRDQTWNERCGGGAHLEGARYTATNLTLVALLEIAYRVKAYQISGGPNWTTSERYTIIAKLPEGDAAAGDQRFQMVETLLKDRFQLKAHREMKDLPTYALILDIGRTDKGGPKLKQSAPDEKTSELSGGGAVAGGPALRADAAPLAQGQYQYTATTMEFLAARLAFHFRQVRKDETPVLDKTGLTGSYDFTLPWTPDTLPGFEAGPSIFTAIRELGLRLEKGKYP